jgi:hypothetical protein
MLFVYMPHTAGIRLDLPTLSMSLSIALPKMINADTIAKANSAILNLFMMRASLLSKYNYS